MKHTVLAVAIALSSLGFAAPEEDDVAVKMVVAKGLGGNQDGALNEAYKDAIQQAVGLYVDSEFAMRNDEIIKDQVLTHSNAYIDRFEKIGDPIKVELGVQICIRAWVKMRDFSKKIKDLSLGSSAQTDGASLSASVETEEWRDERGADILSKELESLDPLRKMMDVKLSQRKPEVVGKDDSVVVVRYFYDLAYSKRIYQEMFVPRMEQVLGQISKNKPKTIRMNMKSGEVDSWFVSLAKESPSMPWRRLHNVMSENPPCQIRGLCTQNGQSYEDRRAMDARMARKGMPIPYIDLVTKTSKTGMLTIKRYEMAPRLVDIYTEWCRSYEKKARDVKFVVQLLDSDGESIAEQEIPVRYAGVFNCPQGRNAFEIVSCTEMRPVLFGNLIDTFDVVFSPLFDVPVKANGGGVLADHIPCYVDVPVDRTELKNVVKAEIRLSELID